MGVWEDSYGNEYWAEEEYEDAKWPYEKNGEATEAKKYKLRPLFEIIEEKVNTYYLKKSLRKVERKLKALEKLANLKR